MPSCALQIVQSIVAWTIYLLRGWLLMLDLPETHLALFFGDLLFSFIRFILKLIFVIHCFVHMFFRRGLST
jgi:hypothetical protein